MKPPAMEKLDVTELFIDKDLTLVYMPDLNLCDFHVKSDKRYLVHFLNPLAFGMEFATIRKGNNVFNLAANEKTECYLFEEAQLKEIVSRSEPSAAVPMMVYKGPETSTPTPCTGPIIIPPTKSIN